MKINMKFLGVSALALALCGCGDGSPAQKAEKAADSAPQTTLADKYSVPKIAEGAILALEFDQRQIDKLQTVTLGEEKSKELAKQAWECLSDDLLAVIKAAGLEDARARWGALSIGEPALKEDMDLKEVPEVAVSIAIDIDVEKTVSAIREQLKKDEDDTQLVEATVGGVKAWKVVDKEGEFAEMKAEPCFAALDGKLFLLASNLAALEKQIKLYRDGVGASAAFANFTLAKGDLLRLSLKDIGTHVKKVVPNPEETLKMLNAFIPDGDKMILGLKALDFAATATADNGVALKLSLGAASEKDADQLRTLAKTGLMPLTAQLKEAAKEDADAKKNLALVEGLKIAGPEGAFEASLVIPAAILKEYAQEAVAKAEKDMAEKPKK
ncbi:MAG: hypothetical protein IJI36_08990 [Kiritimatiellae bacterium]|nr:hypothetical protein [Kiritimatiellia bacterium]